MLDSQQHPAPPQQQPPPRQQPPAQPVTKATPATAASRPMQEIERDIRRTYEEYPRAHEEHKKSERSALSKAIENGRFLLEAKSLLAHGQFQAFVKYCEIPLSTAALHMKLAKPENIGIIDTEMKQRVAANPQSSGYLSQAEA
jgi:DUF3102 family protein